MTPRVPETNPLHLRRLAPLRAALQNALITRRPVLELVAAEGSMSLALAPEPAATGPGRSFLLAAAGMRLTLHLDQATLDAISGVRTDLAAFEDLPPPLQQALVGVTLGPVLDALRERLGIDPSPTDEALDDSDWFRIGLVPMGDTSCLPVGSLRVDDAAAEALTRAIQALPVTPSNQDRRSLPISVTLELARLDLTAAELRDLAMEDVLLLPADAPFTGGTLILRHDDRALATASLEHYTLTIQQRLEATMQQDDSADPLIRDESQTDAPDEPLATADDLTIRLTFDLGQLSLSLAELSQVQPGFVITLDTPAGKPVRIRAGQQIIGRGELVQIDDRLGVVVRELGSADERQSS